LDTHGVALYYSSEMIKVETFVNELMSSNCYILYDDVTKRCIVIDPGSQYSKREIDFIDNHKYLLDYVLLTHEHTDHTWGCNALIEYYPTAKVACSEACAKELPRVGDIYFRLYYDDPNYHYEVKNVDVFFNAINNKLLWNGMIILIVDTPGHSIGSISYFLNEYLFTGDALMMYNPYINKRTGSNIEYRNSIASIIDYSRKDSLVYPGHGDSFTLNDFKLKYGTIFQKIE